jgi:hypothetical protein
LVCITREVGDNVDQYNTQQRSRRVSAHQIKITEDALSNEVDYDDDWSTRMPSSSRRYQRWPDVRSESGRRQVDALQNTDQRYYPSRSTHESRAAIPPRRTATQTGIPAVQGSRQHNIYTDDLQPLNHNRHIARMQGFNFHWLVFVGIAMFIMIIGWVTFNALGSWWQTTQDDWHYGRPRTFQTDAVVGQKDSLNNPSHFIAVNLNRHILIIEMPGGDATKARIFNGPILIGQGQDLAPVTLTFQDVNGDGLLDMVVNVQDAHFVFINGNGTFRPAKTG